MGAQRVMRGAAKALDGRLHMRVFRAMFEANVRRVPGGHVQSLQDFRRVYEFLYSPALLAIMEAPVALVMMVLLFLISPALGWSRRWRLACCRWASPGSMRGAPSRR